MRTFPLVVTVLALWVIFAVTLYLAFNFTFPTVLLAALSMMGILVSIFTYRYYGWPYADKGDYRDIKAGDLHSMIEKGERVDIIDVRRTGEYEAGHLPNSRNVPYQKIERGLTADGKTVFVSGTGKRSRLVLRKVVGKELYNLRDGYMEWAHEHLPIEK